tara:strand:+ start:7302 stop:7814 length:513 start_codon:yes stop_codon:yes gene_type:complete
MRQDRISEAWSNTFAQQFRSDLITHWHNEREYTLEVLEAMPAEYFSYKPAVAQSTFAEQLRHTARANALYFSGFAKDAQVPIDPTSLDKDSLREYVSATFAYVESILSNLSELDFFRRDLDMPFPAELHTAQDIFLRAYRHTADHRGQLICYLRLKGIAPPQWRFPPNGG